jgi:hypothetical protein
VKVREPVARPLDVVAAELLLSASQAFLVGVLFYLAVGVWADRGVGAGPVAVIVAGLGIAIGAGWLFWLLGGVGWPLAAANVPTALFLGFALVLGWRGEELFRVEGIPLLLSLAASTYGLICGVFLDSPRRLRWDQRARPRPGTPVPRVSPTTQRVAAQVPRSIPRRATLPPAELLATRGEPVTAGAMVPGPAPVVGVEAPPAGGTETAVGPGGAGTVAAPVGADEPGVAAASGTVPGDATSQATTTLGSMMPTERLEKMAVSDTASASEPGSGTGSEPGSEPAESPATIVLPTSIEPKAQKSPWAWAAPPEWTRDEDDQPPRRRSSKRS